MADQSITVAQVISTLQLVENKSIPFMMENGDLISQLIFGNQGMSKNKAVFVITTAPEGTGNELP